MKNKWMRILIILTSVGLISTGFSTWIFSGNLNNEGSGVVENVPTEKCVALITADAYKNLKFSSIERAVEFANDLVTPHGNTPAEMQGVQVVLNLPDSNIETAGTGFKCFYAKIKRSFTIKKGVQLILPYQRFGSRFVWTNGVDDIMEGEKNIVPAWKNISAQSYGDMVENNLYSTVEIADNVEITVEEGGSIYIGGECGNNATSGFAGLSGGKYTQLIMGENSKIYNKGLLQCYGFIKPKIARTEKTNYCYIENLSSQNSGGTMTVPLIVNDFGGGGNTYGCYKHQICPFRQFELVNVQVNSSFTINSSLKAKFRFVIEEFEINLISKDQSIFKMDSSINDITKKIVTIEYKNYNKDIKDSTLKTNPVFLRPTSTYSSDRIFVRIFGKCTLDKLLLPVKIDIKILKLDVVLDSSEFSLPFSWKYNIELMEGSDVSCPNSVKLLPGCDFIIHNGAKFTINSDFIVYSDFVVDIINRDFYNSELKNIHYPLDNSAGNAHIASSPYNGGCNFRVDGSLYLGSNSRFGGQIKTACSDGQIFVDYNAKVGCSSIEGNTHGMKETADVTSPHTHHLLSKSEPAVVDFNKNGSASKYLLEPGFKYISNGEKVGDTFTWKKYNSSSVQNEHINENYDSLFVCLKHADSYKYYSLRQRENFNSGRVRLDGKKEHLYGHVKYMENGSNTYVSDVLNGYGLSGETLYFTDERSYTSRGKFQSKSFFTDNFDDYRNPAEQDKYVFNNDNSQKLTYDLLKKYDKNNDGIIYWVVGK